MPVGHRYCTASVTGGLVSPATVTTTGTVSPETPAGTTALIWYNPGYPGVNPLNDTAAFWPPMVTAGMFTVVESGDTGAGAPCATAGVTAPSPVQ